MNRKKKHVQESLVIKNELLLPDDTNPLNNLMGGRLMHWMDIAAAISAMKHCNTNVATVSVDNISFAKPIELGCIVTLTSQVTRAFNTSMEVYIEVMAENIPKKTKFKSNSAYFTLVAVDEKGRPVQVPEAVPETQEETTRHERALRRRELRLIMAGRMKPKDAHELKTLFD